MNDSQLNEQQFEIMKAGYENAFTEIQNCISYRDNLFTLALTGIGLSIGSLAFQVTTQGMPMLILGVYALPIVWMILSMRWTRYNKKISEKVAIRQHIEYKLGIKGAELLAIKAPPTHLRRSARIEMAFLNGMSFLSASLAWWFTYGTNPNQLNIVYAGAAGLSLLLSIFNVAIVYHNRNK